MITVAIADHFAPLMVFSRKLISICRFVNEALEHRQENDFDIEPDAPFADVLRSNSTRFPFSPACQFRRASR